MKKLIFFAATLALLLGAGVLKAEVTVSGKPCVENWTYCFEDAAGETKCGGPYSGCVTIDKKEPWCPIQTIDLERTYFVGDKYGTKMAYCNDYGNTLGGCDWDENKKWEALGSGKNVYEGCAPMLSGWIYALWCPKSTLNTKRVYFEGDLYGTKLDLCKEEKKETNLAKQDYDLTPKPRKSIFTKIYEKFFSKSDPRKVLFSPEIEECFKSGCSDPDAQNFDKKSRTYYKRLLGTQDAKNSLPQKFDKNVNATFVCDAREDYCKGGELLVEFICNEETSDGKKIDNLGVTCPCGCVDGTCQKCKHPDLVVEEIYSPVLSLACKNSIYFKICNKGEKAVDKSFEIKVKAGNVEKLVTFDKDIYSIDPGYCVDFKQTGNLGIGNFGLGLKQDADVTVELDTKNEIEESDDSNNKKTSKVYTGDGYYYDYKKSFECDAFCFDSEGGADPYKNEPIVYKYDGKVTTKDAEYLDSCVFWFSWKPGPDGIYTNGVFIDELDYVVASEKYCNQNINCNEQTKKCEYPIMGEGNSWSNFYKHECDEMQIPHRCEDGKCVPVEKFCKSANGEKIFCMDCSDTDGGNIFQKGDVTYTNIKNKQNTVTDICLPENKLHEYYCTKMTAWPIHEYKIGAQSDVDCGEIKDKDGKGHECKDGACVKTDVDYEKCEGLLKENVDHFKKMTVTETKLLGNKDIYKDDCSGSTVLKYFCEGKKAKSLQFNCLDYKDDKGKSAMCYDGKCCYYDDSVAFCNEGDNGYDLGLKGGIKYNLGCEKDGILEGEDKCYGDNLIEAYCKGKEAMFDKVDCTSKGKKCIEGACK